MFCVMLVLVCNLTRLGEDDAVGLAELPNPPVLVHGAHGEVILVAGGEVGQRAGHRQGQRLHVSHLAAVTNYSQERYLGLHYSGVLCM